MVYEMWKCDYIVSNGRCNIKKQILPVKKTWKKKDLGHNIYCTDNQIRRYKIKIKNRTTI